MNEKTLFLAAIDIADPVQRSAFVEQACRDDAELKQRLELLLESAEEAGDFLESPPQELLATGDGLNDSTHGDSNKTIFDRSVGPDCHQEVLRYLAPSDDADGLGQLGVYKLLEAVGSGGMGAVYRASDTKLDRLVAVKVLSPHLAANGTARQRFLREAKAAAAVSHDHVVTIHAVSEHGQLPYLVMELIEGRSLQQRLDDLGPPSLTEVLRISSQIAAGLAAAHKQGLIHRDIKPSNILLENGVERVKISDFGLARATDDVTITQTGQIAGTPQYMSPEQAKGEAIDHRSDLFSLGSVMFTMFTGRPAFRADSTVAVLRRVCDSEPPSIREANATVPASLEAVVYKLLEKRPEDRFQSADEVCNLLTQHLAHLQNPGQVPQPAMVTPPSHLSRQRRRLAAASAIAIGLALIVVLLSEVGGATHLSKALFAPVPSNSSEVPANSADPQTETVSVETQDSPPSVTETVTSNTDESPAATKVAPTVAKTPYASVAGDPVDLTNWGQIVDPRNKCKLERQSDKVVITVPGTEPFDLIPSNQSAPRLMQDVEGDFIIEAMVHPFERSEPNTSTHPNGKVSWRSGGLAVIADGQTLIRLERTCWAERGAARNILHTEWFGDGKGMGFEHMADTWEGPVGLQIERREGIFYLRRLVANQWIVWHAIPNVDFPAQVAVGITALNTTNTPFTLEVADLRLKGTTVLPRDLVEAQWSLPGMFATWSPDGQSLLRTNRALLELFEASTGKQTALVASSRDACWSPIPGGPFAYVAMGEKKVTAVCIRQGDGSNIRRISNGAFVCGWSADGSLIYDYHPPTNTLRSIEWANADALPTPLMELLAHSPYPSVSPDGRLVAFDLLVKGKPHLVVRELSSGKDLTQTPLAMWNGLLCGWSPDGKLLGYGDYGWKGKGLWMLDIATGKSARVLEGAYTAPHWSPDGKWIAVDNRPAGEVEVFAASDLMPTIDAAAGAPPVGPAPYPADQAQTYQKDWADYLKQPVEYTNSLSMTLRLIPPARFSFGTEPEKLKALTEGLDNPALSEPRPRTAVVSQPFYLGTREVTVAQFRRFAKEAGYETDAEKNRDGGAGYRDGHWVRRPEHTWRAPGGWMPGDDEPVVQVSWMDAMAFCAWLSEREGLHYHLPTELSWELAARAGGAGLFGQGDDPSEQQRTAWYKELLAADRGAGPLPVGSKEPNAFGLFDMLGNVNEWTSSRSLLHPNHRAIRGGGWYDQAHLVRPGACSRSGQQNRALDACTGFRVAILGDLTQPMSPRAGPDPDETLLPDP